MSKRVWLNAVLVGVLLVAAIPVAGQGDSSQSSPLLADLSLVPNTLHSGNGWATVRYVDFQALYQSEGIDELLRTANQATLMDSVPIAGILSRIVVGSEVSVTAWMRNKVQADQMPQVVGFSFFADVNRTLEYGTPPETGYILAGTFDEAAIAATLSARDFEQAERGGITIWHRFEDAQVNMMARELADPFGGSIGLAARIAVLPGHLANSRYWAITEEIVATAQGEQESLADNPDYRALAEAISAPEGLLIQALFFPPEDIGLLPSLDAEATAGYGALGAYALAVLADRQEGSDQVHLIGLVYANADQAQAAAEEVAARVTTFDLPNRPPRDVLVDYYGAQVTTSVYESESAGNAVALVEVRYPLPADRIDPATKLFITGGRMYTAWVRAIAERAFPVLVITE